MGEGETYLVQRPTVRLKYLIEKYFASVRKDNIIDAKPHRKQRRVRLPSSQRSVLVAVTILHFTSLFPLFLILIAHTAVSLTNIIRQELFPHLRGECGTSVYQVRIDRRAIHGEIVRFDFAVVVRHGEVLDPFKIRGLGVISRVAERVF